MNYVKALFNKLYKSGFVDEPKNQKNAIAAILLLHEFYKAKCMDKEMLDFLNSKESGKSILETPTKDIKALNDVSKYYDIMEEIAVNNKIDISTNISNKKLYDKYKAKALKENVIMEKENLISYAFIDDSLIIKPKKKKVTDNSINKQDDVKVEDKKEENNIINDNVIIDHDEDVEVKKEENNKNNADFIEFKVKLLKFAEYASMDNENQPTTYKAMEVEEGANVFGNALKEIVSFVMQGEKPIEFFKKIAPVFDDPNINDKSSDNVLSFLGSIANNGLKDKNLQKQLLEYQGKHLSVKEAFEKFEQHASQAQIEAFEKLFEQDNGGPIHTFLNRIYSPLGDNYHIRMANDVTSLPTANTFVPKANTFDLLFQGSNPDRADIHELRDYIKNNIKVENDPEYSEALKIAGDVVIVADQSINSSISIIGEHAAQYSGKKIVNQALEDVNKANPNLLIIKNRALYLNGTTEELINFYKTEFNKNLQYPEAKRNELKEIVKYINDNKLFDFTGFNGESADKEYGLMGLLLKRREIEQLVRNNPNREAIIKASNEYKELESKLDIVLDKMKNFSDTDLYPDNVASTRNGLIPGKYRYNVLPVSRLNGLYVAMGLCNKYGIDINEFIDKPLEMTTKMMNNLYSNTITMQKFNNAIDDIPSFIDYLADPYTRKNDVLSAIDKGICRPGELLSRIMPGSSLSQDLDLVQTYLNEITAKASDIFNELAKNPSKTIANMMLYRNEDRNPFNVCPTEVDLYNPLTLQKNKPVPLTDYIAKNYTYHELANKLADLNKYYKLSNTKPEIQDAMKEITTALGNIPYIKDNKPAGDFLLDCLKTGNNPTLEALNEEDVNLDVDNRFVDFYNKYNNLLVKSLGFVNQDVEASEKISLIVYQDISKKQLDFYADKFNQYIKEHGIDIKILNYDDNTKGITQFMHDYVNGKINDQNIKIELPENLFDSYALESKSVYENRFDVPKELVITEEDKQKAEYISQRFIGVKSDITGSFHEAELLVENATLRRTTQDVANGLIAKDKTYENSFKFDRYNADFKIEKDLTHRDAAIKSIDEFKLSDNTKNNILTVLDKMEEYGMLIDFNPNGEDPFKTYGFKKYNNAYMEVNNALEEKDLNKAYEASKKYDEIKAQYDDILKLCEKLFPQDGLHCSGNISISRNSYCPLDFTVHQQAMIQLNSIYFLANLCDKYKLDIREALNNPSGLLKNLLNIQKNELVASATKENTGASLITAITGIDNNTLTVGRALEGLVVLENDPENALNNSKANMFFKSIYEATGRSYDSFFTKAEDGKFALNRDLLNIYIASNGSLSMDNFLNNTINPETGRNYECFKTLEEVLNDTDKDLTEFLNDTYKLIADATVEALRINEEELPNENFNPNDLLVSSAEVVKKFLLAKDLNKENSVSVDYAKFFINNPYEAMNMYVKKNMPDNANIIEELYSKEAILEKLDKSKILDSVAFSKTLEYDEGCSTFNIDTLEVKFDALKGNINSSNLYQALLIAKNAQSRYDNRGMISSLGSNARREKNLVNNIKNELKKVYVNDKVVQSIINNEYDDLPCIIMQETDKLKVKEKADFYTNEKIEEKLNSIFEEPKQKLTVNQITETMDLCKEIKKLLNNSLIDQNIKEMFHKSSKMIQDKVFEKGLSYEFQRMVIDNELTSEEAMIEMGVANGNIVIDMEEDRGEIEPIIDNDIINVNQLNKG